MLYDFLCAAIVIIALSCTIFELFNVEWYGDLEICFRHHSRSLKLVPLESLGAVSYLPSIVTGRICSRLWDIQRQKNSVTLKTGLGFVQGHWKWYHVIDRIAFPCNCGAILYRLRDIASYWSKIAKFLYPPIFNARRNFAKMFDIHKTRMIGLLCGEETVTILL